MQVWSIVYMTFDLPVWPRPWTSMAEHFVVYIVLLLWTFVPNIIKIGQGICKIWSGHEGLMKFCLYDLWPHGMTLTLNQHDRIFRSAHRLVIVNICTKYYQIPLKHMRDMEWTLRFDEIRSIWHLTSQYDLDLEPTWLNVLLCTLSCHCEHLYQILSKSVQAYARYGADTKRDRQTDNQYKININYVSPPLYGET